MKVKIRQENKYDFSSVFKVNKLAFGQDSEAKLVGLLRHSDTFVPELSLVLTIDNVIVGHILFTKIKIVDEKKNLFDSLALAPMAVRPDNQRNGIGGQLIITGLNKAKELNFNSVIVLGHRNYYPKFGFVPTCKWNIKSPFDVPTEAFMGVELTKNGLKVVSGTVIYPKEFDTL